MNLTTTKYLRSYAQQINIKKLITAMYAKRHSISFYLKVDIIGIILLLFTLILPSKFCGMSVCDDHSKKRRSDPQTPGSYVRICDDCDKKYINKMILDEFKGKLKRRDEELKELELKASKLQKVFKEKQNTYDNQVSEV